MTTTTQTQQILNWLKQGRGLTSLQALRRFKTLRLAARIHQLKQQGHKIEKQTVTTASGKPIARYRLA